MNATTIERRFRTFLLVLAGFICSGTIVELWLAKHTESATQFIPFVLCGVGLIVVLGALLRPQRGTLIVLRVVMAILIVGSGLGIYEHLAGNMAFALEIRPSATVRDVFFSALRGGDPLLAPGILALAGIIALAVTYYHPALGNRADVQPVPSSDDLHPQHGQASGGRERLHPRDS